MKKSWIYPCVFVMLYWKESFSIYALVKYNVKDIKMCNVLFFTSKHSCRKNNMAQNEIYVCRLYYSECHKDILK